MSQDLNRRLYSMFQRGVLTHMDVQAGLAMPQAEFVKKNLRRVEMPQGYGLATMPTPGSEVFALFRNGEEDDGVVLAYDDARLRGKLTFLESGEVALYGPNIGDETNGHHVWMTDSPKAGTIKVKASRIELRAGKFYVLIDSDPTIGMQKGEWTTPGELPENPEGSPL